MASVVMDLIKNKYQGKKVLVVGLGLQGGGVGIVRFFAEIGAKVTVTDIKSKDKLLPSINILSDLPVSFHLNGHRIEDFMEADVIFKGPSVPWTSYEIIQAQKKQIPVEMELSFFTKYFPGKIIGVTGTRGKSTVTNLIYNLMKDSEFPVFLGGGIPGISTINYLNTLTENDWVVMEISSWALSGFHRKKISPHIAVLTNIYPDHLNYYRTMNEYIYDKKAIFMYQTNKDYLLVNKNLIKGILDNYSGSTLNSSLPSKIIFFSKKDFPYELKYLKGEHNIENAAAALQVAEILKIDEKKAVKTIVNFKGLPYRQEIIRETNGVLFINDTTSTTPIATIKAIEVFKNNKIILILGGNSKKLPFEDLLPQLSKVEKIVLLEGSFTNEIVDSLKKIVPSKLTDTVYDNLESAVEKAYELALKISPSVVLFSPGATSFSMFNNEFHRGKEFNKIVEKLN